MTRVKNLYHFPSTVTSSTTIQSYLSPCVPIEVWHSQLRHPSYKTIRNVISKFSLPISSNKIPSICIACQQGKNHCLFFLILHLNPLILSNLYFLTFWALPLLCPLMGINIMFHLWIILASILGFFLFPTNPMSTQFLFLLKNLLNAFSIVKSNLFKLIGERIIAHSTIFLRTLAFGTVVTCPHTLQQNGSIERKHWHIDETSFFLLSHSFVPHDFLDDAFLMTTYLINSPPSTPHLLKNYMVHLLIFLIYGSLVVHVSFIYVISISINLIFGPNYAYFWATTICIEALNVWTFLQAKYF